MLAVGSAPAGSAGGPAVVELFTSQSCYSCPPAEAFLGDLARRDGVIALEFHVDYWDDLVYGRAGKWKDVFSSPEYTRRQQGYNLNIRGRGQVYTPQMIIDGRAEAVGTRRGDVTWKIESVFRDNRPRLTVTVSAHPGGGLGVTVDGPVAETGRDLAGALRPRQHHEGAGRREQGQAPHQSSRRHRASPDRRLAGGEGVPGRAGSRPAGGRGLRDSGPTGPARSHPGGRRLPEAADLTGRRPGPLTDTPDPLSLLATRPGNRVATERRGPRGRPPAAPGGRHPAPLGILCDK